MNDREKTMMLHVALGAFESVRNDETPKSARYRRMTNAIDRLLEVLEIYHPDAWPVDDIIKASNLVDEFNIRIKEVFKEDVP